MTKAKKLRELLKGSKIIMAPGAYDAWSARLIEKAGFPVVYMTGYGVSASVLGRPDIGLISMQEMAEAAKNICACTEVLSLPPFKPRPSAMPAAAPRS